MPTASFPQSFIYRTHTATTDAMFNLTTADLWMREANIHVETNNAKYGDRAGQDAQITAGDVVIFEDFNLLDVFFKNAGAGANTVIRVVGVVMTEGRKKDLGISEYTR
jgi:hypothetical protein